MAAPVCSTATGHFSFSNDRAQHNKMPPMDGTDIPLPAIFVKDDTGTPSKFSLQPELADACDLLHGRTCEFRSSCAESTRSCSCSPGSQWMTAGCGWIAKLENTWAS